MKSAWPIRFLRGFFGVILAIFGIATLGIFAPQIPFLGESAPALLNNFGLLIVIISFIGGLWALNRWRSNRRKRTLLVAGLALFAAFGLSYVQYQQVRVAEAFGTDIDLATAVFPKSQARPAAKLETVNYLSHEGQALPLDIYRPTKRAEGVSAPVFIYIHGGGWGGQTLKQRQADFQWFADRGYLVISLEYTLSSATRITWNVAEPQLGCALAWVNANAARYGGDTRRIAVWGESAGGNLALNVTYRANNGTLKPACGGALPTIKAVVALYPVIDVTLMYHNPGLISGHFARIMAENYTGGSPKEFPQRYAAIDPTSHISAKAPPTLLIIPNQDHLVLPVAAKAFASAAKGKGVKATLQIMPFAEHSFDLPSGGIGNQFVRQSMAQFLEKQGLKP